MKIRGCRSSSIRGFFCCGCVDDGVEGVGGGLTDAADAAEVFDEARAGARAYAGDGEQFGLAVAYLAALAVVGYGEAVALVADLLHEMEDGGAAVEHHGFVLLTVDVDDLFAFGDGSQGLQGDAEFFQCCVGCVELAQAAIDKDEGWEWLVVFLKAFVAAVDDLAHAGEVVDAGDGADLELAVVGLLHGAVFPDDHGGDGFGALDVGDVEALDAAGQFFEGEGVLEGLLNGLDAGLEDAETLVVGLAGVLTDEVDEGTLFAALGGEDFYALAGACGEDFGEEGAVGELDGNEDGAGDVVLVEVKLLEEGGEECGGAEGGV